MNNKQEIKNNYTQRWYAFDFVKGILIILVFLGHIIPGVQRDTFPRYFIYSFHMPLFIGISGFLLNIEKMDMRFSKVFAKYWKRVGLPWVIAVLCYFIIGNIISRTKISFFSIDFLKAFCYPYYHLWYILGFASYLLLSWILWKIFSKNRFKWIIIFLIVSIVSIFSKGDFLNGRIDNIYLASLYKYIQYDFRLYNWIFFVLGIYCRYKYERNQKILSAKTMEIVRAVMVFSIVSVVIVFYFDYPNIENILFYIMNICILLVVKHDCVNAYFPRSHVLEFIGKYSLPIYLYHILCKVFSAFFFIEGSEEYYISCIATFVVGCVIVYFLTKIQFVNKVIFGSTTSGMPSRSQIEKQ